MPSEPTIRGDNALIIVDLQQGFDDPSWGPGDNPDCEENVGRLLAGWRAAGGPVVFVRHDSSSPSSPLRPGQAGNDFKPVIEGTPDLLITKQVNSAFYGEPALQDWLDQREISAVTICGIAANHCCETTARMAGNLGYRVWFVLDATRAFDREAMDGSVITAAEIRRVTGANLHGEFATVCSTDDILSAQRAMPTRSVAGA